MPVPRPRQRRLPANGRSRYDPEPESIVLPTVRQEISKRLLTGPKSAPNRAKKINVIIPMHRSSFLEVLCAFHARGPPRFSDVQIYGNTPLVISLQSMGEIERLLDFHKTRDGEVSFGSARFTHPRAKNEFVVVIPPMVLSHTLGDWGMRKHTQK